MREIVLDTETTGFKPEEGHRVIEIGCVELINHVATDNHFHVFINPERPIPEDATRVHGITDERVANEPLFGAVVDEFLAFVGDSPIIAHNASFDAHFLNWELVLAGKAKLANEIIDTLAIARRKFPGAPATLDALCRRFGVDNSGRTFHGALLDAQLLAEVYLELLGGRQAGLDLSTKTTVVHESGLGPVIGPRGFRPPRPHAPTPEELEAHAAMVAGLKNAVWTRE